MGMFENGVKLGVVDAEYWEGLLEAWDIWYKGKRDLGREEVSRVLAFGQEYGRDFDVCECLVNNVSSSPG